MIDWRVVTKNGDYQEKNWYFPTFLIQEYLIPLINAGFSYIDEYGETEFAVEDSKRIRGNIKYLLDSKYFNQKEVITYDSFYNGIVLMNSEEIIDCLMDLDAAFEYAIKNTATVIFYGD